MFTSDRLWGSGEEKDEEGETIPSGPVGVTTGLAWTSMGGSTLYVVFERETFTFSQSLT